jgi:hypothetical protein
MYNVNNNMNLVQRIQIIINIIMIIISDRDLYSLKA